MVFARKSRLQQLALILLTGLFFGQTFISAFATELPQTVVQFIRGKDTQAQIRFDGLVTFSNGETYLPIIPQDPSLNPEPQQVVNQQPEGKIYPDLVQFDNNFFLIRLVQTASGKLTFPRMENYPIELKEGLLPQDLVLPENLYIPTELKVLLGDLPYNPSMDAVNPDLPPTNLSAIDPHQQRAITTNALYLSNLTNNGLTVIDPARGTKKEEVDLRCVPSSVKASPDSRLLFATCLTSDELVVVDASANLIKTRIPVSAKPADMVFIPERNQVIVSHNFSDQLSIIDMNELVPGSQLALPGSGGVMTYSPRFRALFVANPASNEIYEMDTESLEHVRTLKTLPNVTGLWIQEEGDRAFLWVLSKSQGQLGVYDLSTGDPLSILEVGKKAMEMAVANDMLFVVSADSDRLDVINWKERTVSEPINFSKGSFPTGIVLSPEDRYAYVSSAGASVLYVVDLETRNVEQSFPVGIRGTGIALIGPPKDIVPVDPSPEYLMMKSQALQETAKDKEKRLKEKAKIQQEKDKLVAKEEKEREKARRKAEKEKAAQQKDKSAPQSEPSADDDFSGLPPMETEQEAPETQETAWPAPATEPEPVRTPVRTMEPAQTQPAYASPRDTEATATRKPALNGLPEPEAQPDVILRPGGGLRITAPITGSRRKVE